MLNATRIRFWIGWLALAVLDAAVVAKLLPARFPNGLHLEYDLQRFLAAPVTTIIDGGANVGNTALGFARFFRAATVHAFEPVSKTFQLLEKRTRDQKRIICQQLALGEHESDVTITLSADSETNSLLTGGARTGGAGYETVHVVRLDDYAVDQGLTKIDLLKLDLEGYEVPALRGAARLLKQGFVRAIYSECGLVSKDPGKTSFGELNELIQSYGFRFAGFYQTFRYGPNKRWVLFSNGLWLHEGTA